MFKNRIGFFLQNKTLKLKVIPQQGWSNKRVKKPCITSLIIVKNIAFINKRNLLMTRVNYHSLIRVKHVTK